MFCYRRLVIFSAVVATYRSFILHPEIYSRDSLVCFVFLLILSEAEGPTPFSYNNMVELCAPSKEGIDTLPAHSPFTIHNSPLTFLPSRSILTLHKLIRFIKVGDLHICRIPKKFFTTKIFITPTCKLWILDHP